MSIVGSAQFFGSPEEERKKLLQSLQLKKTAATGVPSIALNSGHAIPQVGFGTYKIDPSETERLVTEALAAGYRHIDTAAYYGNEAGVGAAIANSGIPRSELFVTTKLWNDRHFDVEKAYEESLTKLGLDYVDLYLIHWPALHTGSFETAWEQLQGLAGARSIGVSNFLPEHLDSLVKNFDTVPAVNQIELHPRFQQCEVVAAVKQSGIVVESWGPLGQGRYDLTAEQPIMAAAEAHGKTPVQIVLRWHVQQGFVVIPKTTRPERMAENIDIFDFSLSDTEMEAIMELERNARGGPHPLEYA